MRLKRIELAGFKSFVDPTKIDLDKGITAIVGPNGCGKSNIVDALRWVLGEHSARHLRGGVMDDLIFQGSDTRPPVAICDVELTFAIASGALPSPYHKLNEIRIRRRLTREGGSDAFINGKMVRLKDVVDLFLDTGISTRAYAIVEQGSIARMVTAKPEERRVIFEEAAGVMKYRSRRREAERRMKDTRLNLDRVLDLLEEVRSQCRSLKQQASRAERFKKLQDEFGHLQSLSLALRFGVLQQQYQDIEAQAQIAQKLETECGQQLASHEQSVSQARQGLLKHENEAQAGQDELRRAERQRADLQQQAERMAGERRLLAERQAALQRQISATQAQQQRLADDLAHVTAQCRDHDDAGLQAQQLAAVQAVEAASLAYQAQGAQRDALLAEVERLRYSNDQARQLRHNAEQALHRLQQREQLLNADLTELADQLNQQRDACTDAARQLNAAQQSRQLSETALLTAQAELDRCQHERETRLQALNEQDAALRECSGVAQELRARTKNQDVSDTLRDTLRASGGIWMDELLHVPEGLEAAVAAALRGRSADVRMPTTCLQSMAAWRQAGSAPVALFSGTVSSHVKHAQSLALAMQLQADHPLYDVFVGVRLLDDIVDAEGATVCCVSRDGWRREADGWLIPPAANRTADRLAVQRQLRDASAREGEAESALAQVQQQFDVAEKNLDAQQQAWQQAHVSATQGESDERAAEAAEARLQAEVTALQQHQQRLQSDVLLVAEERQYWSRQAQQAMDVDQQMQHLTQAEEKLQVQMVVLDQANAGLDQARHTLAQVEQALALLAQAHDNLIRESARLQHEEQRLQAQMRVDTEHLQQAESALAKASEQGGLDARLRASVAAVEAAHLGMNALRSKGHDLQQTQHECERHERQARQQLQLALEQRQSISVQQAQAETRWQDLAVEIEQRCQCTAADLLQRFEGMAERADSAAIMQRRRELEERLGRFGPVNLLAIEEFEQADEREGFLAGQVADLETSLATLTDTIGRIDRTTRQRFLEVFEQTNAYFKQTFPQLFGGGRAELKLDSDDVLTAGVEVVAQPPGKRLQDVSLLSGGEKALTAVALVFSIFKIKPAPFCVLDEVDAPLDDANVARFGEMVRELSDRVQFLSISHNKITMQQADRLIGVSMPEPGVSKIVAVDLERVPL